MEKLSKNWNPKTSPIIRKSQNQLKTEQKSSTHKTIKRKPHKLVIKIRLIYRKNFPVTSQFQLIQKIITLKSVYSTNS